MCKEYDQARDIIKKTKIDLVKLLSGIKNIETFEERETLKIYENLIETIDESEGYLDYLKNPTKEGVLENNPKTGMYYICFDDGTSGADLECGNVLELCDSLGGWHVSGIEKNIDGRYYFNYGDWSPLLDRGFRARKRI
ncbi:MAG: hypothetical protein BI182_10805 [Acetobacterium sp. MES1]|uniref:hypothetical protein n=1 Tax=Acetobacterium sp. MES1 TaxID=1899015 RepID=UPI000B9C9ACC|nr:hypothetical protein [Acetobacterium sp. MES1]OXS27170.1 MAG: hypothetical protein BI182_10805 [Acetobacterium sp. MES1]